MFVYRCTMCQKNPIGLLRHISQVMAGPVIIYKKLTIISLQLASEAEILPYRVIARPKIAL